MAPTPDLRPGPWLRLTALAAAIAPGFVVATGALGMGKWHDAMALLGLAPLVALVVAAWWAHRHLLRAALVALLLFLVAIGFGGLLALTGSDWARGAHIGFAGLAFVGALVLAAATLRGAPAPRGAWRDYVTLTKPRIMTLLLWTGLAGMFVGAQGVPALWLIVVTMAGLALACGGASALNHVLDADIDRLMGSRTEKRPVASGRVAPSRALEFGLALSALSFVLLASFVNVLTAVLALVGNLFYVVVYTRWLKRTTPQNIVIGGAAGAVPPLVGWAAATGNLSVPAIALFAIVFVWTPPHFWALALLIKENYAAAKVPMLPNVRGDRETARQIVLYTVGMIAVTLVPFALGWSGALYLGGALVLGGIFLVLALKLQRDLTKRRAAILFHYSLLYLALLFTAMALDPILL
ncbi:MAG: heme o synthase [Gaiellaceae bacterium]|nr:heme o synthase [Gaiellaceae bacterium]